MLRISGWAPSPGPARIETDAYIPVTVSWRQGEPAPTLYWRTGDLLSSLLEVGIDPGSGALISITVTLAGAPVRAVAEREPAPGVPARPGHPVCDLHPWKTVNPLTWRSEVCVDEPEPFELTLYADRLRISFDGGGPAASSLVSGPVRFDLSGSGGLLAVSLGGIEGHQCREIVETVASVLAASGACQKELQEA